MVTEGNGQATPRAGDQPQWTELAGQSVSRLPGQFPDVALTFDDGPSNETPRFLELLDKLGVLATFFLCGRNVRRRPAVARAICDAGHAVGNHSHSHPVLPLCSRSRITLEVNRAQDEIRLATGHRPGLFRPPYGLSAPALGGCLGRAGLISVRWTVIGKDWKLDSSRIVRRVLKRAGPRSIICLHDGDATHPVADRSETLAAVLRIVPELRRRGLRFVPLPAGPSRYQGNGP